jgi:hypothetical protein
VSPARSPGTAGTNELSRKAGTRGQRRTPRTGDVCRPSAPSPRSFGRRPPPRRPRSVEPPTVVGLATGATWGGGRGGGAGAGGEVARRWGHLATRPLPDQLAPSLSLSLALALALSVGIGIGIGVCVCVSCVSSCVPSCVPSCVRVRADHDDEPWPSPRFRHRVDSRAERVVSLPCFPSSGRCGGSCLCRDQPAVFRD